MLLFGKPSPRTALRVNAFVLGLFIALPAQAQIIKLTAQVAGTVNSLDQKNDYGGAATCVFTQASHTGTPSSTFSIQGKDPGGSGLYYTLITSAAVTADATPTAIAAGKGVQSVANVSVSLPLPQRWRASITVAGTSPVVTGTVGCIVN